MTQKEKTQIEERIVDVLKTVYDPDTDTKELSSSELLQEDYMKYSGMFPIPERIREQLVREEEL